MSYLDLPTHVTDSQYDSVCELIRGGMTVNKSLQKLGITWNEWQRYIAQTTDERKKIYAQSKLNLIDHVADTLLDLVDESPAMINDRGTHKIDPAWPQIQKLRIETRRWLLSKLRPAVYGELQQITHNVNVNVQLADRLAAAEAALAAKSVETALIEGPKKRRSRQTDDVQPVKDAEFTPVDDDTD